jgi:hypothetical protein
MHNYVIILVLLVIAVLLAMEGPKFRLSKYDKLKSYNTNRLNKLENPQISVSVSDNSRTSNIRHVPQNNYLLLDPSVSRNARDRVNRQYGNIFNVKTNNM